MQEVAPDIYVITQKGGLGGIKPPVNIYVLPGTDGIIFDAGYGQRRAVSRLIRDVKRIQSRRFGQHKASRITRILISHCHPDHFSGLRRIRSGLGLSIVLTERMQDLISSGEAYRRSYDDSRYYQEAGRAAPVRRVFERVTSPLARKFYRLAYGIQFVSQADQTIDEESTILINDEAWRVFHSPGHSEDHISLYNRERGILFAGDNVLRAVTPWLGPPKSNLTQYIQSLEYMLTLPNLKLILSAHGSPVTNPRERIRELIAWRHQRTIQIYEIIKARGKQGTDRVAILQSIYPGAGWAKTYLAMGWILLSLEHLLTTKKIAVRQQRPKILYTALE